MKFHLRVAVAAILATLCVTPSVAQTQWPTPKAGVPAQGYVMMCLNSSGFAVPVDQNGACPTGGGGSSGAVFGPTAAGSAAANPPIIIGGTADGTAAGNVTNWKVLSGIGYINCANCSGSGISVPFAGAIGANGTPGGFKDGSGNFQPLLGDVTNGQWVNIKSSVSLGVTGTFWQATQPVSAASLPLPNGAATAANQATEISSLATIATNTGAVIPTQSPTVSIGGVGIIDSAGTNVATVKAASTLPAATDKTLVVGLNPGTATAGSPTGAIVTVQGVASGTPLSVSRDGTANGATHGLYTNLLQGDAVNSATNPVFAAVSANSTANSATNPIFETNGAQDPCRTQTASYLPITATTSLVKVIATGVSAKKIYICQLLLTTTAANNVALFEATTGTTCATSPVAVYGAGTTVATAANGFPFAANGGVSLGSGGYFVAQTTVNNNDLCIGTSAATPLTGGIKYVVQ